MARDACEKVPKKTEKSFSLHTDIYLYGDTALRATLDADIPLDGPSPGPL